MKRNEKSPPDMYDPTVKTTVDEVRSSIEDPGRLIETTADGETTFELNRALILIGNDPAADIILDDSRVADYHAEISYEKGFYILRQLNDKSPVTVGGKPIREYILTDGDEIRLAGRGFVFRAGAGDRPPGE